MQGTLEEIEKAVSRLSRKELSEFRTWYEEFEAREWDRQFEGDVEAGRLDEIADRELEKFRKGQCTKL